MSESGLQIAMPPCSRYEGVEDNDRVQLAYAFAMGLLGESRAVRVA
jgi:hypothetical protein